MRNPETYINMSSDQLVKLIEKNIFTINQIVSDLVEQPNTQRLKRENSKGHRRRSICSNGFLTL